MKKSLIGLLSVMVVLAFTASAFALHQVKSAEYTPGIVKSGKSQIKLGGEIRIRGNLQKNTDFDNQAKDTGQSYDQRVRLKTTANIAEKTSAVVELETKMGSSSNYSWGCTGCFNSKSQALYLRQAFISHQFGMIGGIKAGHMLLALGNRLFYDNTNYGDDALLGWLSVGPGELTLIDIKAAENTDKTKLQADDVDAYVLALEMPVNAVNVSADVTYLRDRNTTTGNYTGTATSKGLKLFNIGARAAADLKVVKVMGDIEVQTGKAEKGVATPKKYKYSGYAAMVGVEANAGPATIRAKAAYGSGDKQVKSTKTDKKNEGFQTILTDSKYSTFVYDYSVMTAAGAKHTGLNNTMFLNVGASVKPITDLKLSLDAYYLQAAKARALNGARKDLSVACAGTTDTCKTSKKLGYEVDGKVEYQLASNLTYYIEAGYLFAGEAYNVYKDGKNRSSDNPYRVRHGLIIKF